MQSALVNNIPPAFGGPYGISALLLPRAQAAPVFEGPWVRIAGAKSLSLDLFGSQSSLSLDLYGTNDPSPVNGYTFTIGGSVTNGDTVSAVFTTPNIPGVPTVTKTVTAGGSDTVTTLAAAMVAAIAADTNLNGLGIEASNAAGVITINFPSTSQGGDVSAGTPAYANFIGLTSALSGGATETATVATLTTGNKIGASLTALALTAVAAPLPLYIKARLQTLTGTGANVTAAINAAV